MTIHMPTALSQDLVIFSCGAASVKKADQEELEFDLAVHLH
jgi:hypothetical protein